mmetsp:Transcript_7725/g.10126  ORF Transcript_7725/g.10126 Transcript_7725/m.10126 type:complete len:113 (-) Transcript_7725:244-582(-)|eukprot:CAMPEP_0198141940 /NCGR_PEP_ID=MMETSP1443-20131203/4856_1 /TAXON_ID=186043 /ORGANISM="Entomoneis sp., Strain CCMP2396" /LENGTH=112 /DNA_ID=CAMNT_0043804833 /DNA_START=167 /DNA_END=505 /DNA_ORIENTATION=+
MLTTTIRTLSVRSSAQVAHALPRAFAARSFSVGDTFGNKEKVEEARYMRDLEKKYIEKKKAEAIEKMHEDDETKFAEQIAPSMAEIKVLLSKTGDSVSHDALESLAKWKVGL